MGRIPGLHASPLRYPGGKKRLSNFVRLVYRANGLMDGEYAEVYAGGASVALSLLYGEYARRIHINDLDRGVHAFWVAAVDHTDELCRLVRDATVTTEEWQRLRGVHQAADPDPLELGYATFFLNRVNRSGIIRGGLIGGRAQEGVWRMDVRFEKDDLVPRIEKIGRYRSRIAVHGLDAAAFIKDVVPSLPARSLLYLDPPYYMKGQRLYQNAYRAEDHKEIAASVAALDRPWIVTYDDVPAIRSLYAGFESMDYGIAYSARVRQRGREVAFFSPGLVLPDVDEAADIPLRDFKRVEAELLTGAGQLALPVGAAPALT